MVIFSHLFMRKVAGDRLRALRDAGGWQRLVFALGLVLSFNWTGHAEAESASVRIQLLSDGRCAVAAEGAGFRSAATYMPKGDLPPAQLTCAMPPVPHGRALQLEVVLPEGVGRPGSSAPALAWARVDDRWVGTASLTEWPDAVEVVPDDRGLWLRLGVAAAAFVVAGAAVGGSRLWRPGPRTA